MVFDAVLCCTVLICITSFVNVVGFSRPVVHQALALTVMVCFAANAVG